MELQVPFETYLGKYKRKYNALYFALRDTILSGLAGAGAKLPSSREMAAIYGISRGTVNQVYDMLQAEGYIYTEAGKGTYVSYTPALQPAEQDQGRKPRLSPWGERIVGLDKMRNRGSGEAGPDPGESGIGRDDTIRFIVGESDYGLFPAGDWNRMLYAQARVLSREYPRDDFVVQGHWPLREAIAAHLRKARGIAATPDNIAITNGSMQAIAILAQLLIREGDAVVMEDPGYLGIRHAVEVAGGVPLPVPVDECGMRIEDDWDVRLAFVTPARQYPSGAVMSLERRLQLLRWASRRKAIVVEDDYDSEFRYGGRPLEPLKALDEEARVVYIGTFSKTLRRDLRIAYAVLPAPLKEAFVKAKQLYEPHPPGLMEQRVIAAFMREGLYEKHLRRMKRVYRKKYETLFALLQTNLSPLFHWIPGDAGLHIFGIWNRSPELYEPFARQCRNEGVIWTDADHHYFSDRKPSVCFGFPHLSESSIREGIKRIVQVATAMSWI